MVAERLEHVERDAVFDGIENSVRKITSAGGMGGLRLDVMHPRRQPLAGRACGGQHGGKLSSRRATPSNAGSMMRRWRAQSAPFAMKTPLPNNGARPLRMRFDFGKSPGDLQDQPDQRGSLQKKLWITGLRNSAIHAPYRRSGSAPAGRA